MKITIILATFNAGAFLCACLDSIIGQTWSDKEIIVIDGGSTDDTVEIIKRYTRHIAFWISEPDDGIYDAWNKALSHVSGSWILFRGADDVFWNTKVLESAIPGLSATSPTELVCYGKVVRISGLENVVGIDGRPWPEAKASFFRFMSVPHPGTFHHVELFKRFGKFDTAFKIAGDYDFLLRVFRSGQVEAKFLPNLIVTKMSVSGISNELAIMTKLESIAALRKNRISHLPLTQFRQMALILFLSSRRKIVRMILGESRFTRLRIQRQERKSAEMLRSITSQRVK